MLPCLVRRRSSTRLNPMSEHSDRQLRAGSLLVIFLTVFIDLLGFGMVMPLLPIYAEQYAVDPEGWTIGLLMACFSFMQFIFAPLWGMLSDRVGRRPVLMVGLGGSVICYSLFAYAALIESLTWLFVTRIGAGIAGATIPTAQAYIADATPPAKRSHGMALIGMAMGLGFTFGPLFGYLAMPTHEGDPGPWPGVAAAGLSAIALLMAIFLLPESKPPGVQSTARKWLDIDGLRHALIRKSIFLLLLAYFAFVLGFVMLETTLSLLLWKEDVGDTTLEKPYTPFDFTWRQLCLTYAFVGFTLAVVQGALIRPLSKRVSDVILISVGASTELIGFGLMIYAINVASVTWLFVGLGVVVSGFAFVQPAIHGLISNFTSSTQQGSVLGFAQSLNAVARIVGTLISIPLLKQATSLPYSSASVLMITGALFVIGASRLHRLEKMPIPNGPD